MSYYYNRPNYGKRFLWTFIFLIVAFFAVMYYSPSARSKTLEYLSSSFFSDKNDKDSVKVIADNREDSIRIVEKVVEKQIDGDTIMLQKGSDNMYYLPVDVNGLKMSFTLDTGCSDMSMSVIEYEFMKKHGYLKDSDVISQGKSTIANGETVDNLMLNLKSIKIGNYEVKNVQCSVMMNSEAPTLLGQDVLQKIGNVLISYNKNCIIVQK